MIVMAIIAALACAWVWIFWVPPELRCRVCGKQRQLPSDFCSQVCANRFVEESRR